MSGKEMEYSLAGIAEWQIQNVAWLDCSSHNYMWHLCCVIGGVAKSGMPCLYWPHWGLQPWVTTDIYVAAKMDNN